MKTRISSRDIAEMSFETYYPARLIEGPEVVKERAYQVNAKYGQASYQETVLKDIIIGHANIDFGQDTQINFEGDFETLEMHFHLTGETFTKEDGTTQHFSFGAGEHNLIYAHGFKGISNWPGQKICIFEANLMPSFFKPYLMGNGPHSEQLAKLIKSQQNGCLHQHNLPITPKMVSLIYEINHCDRSGIFKKLFLEAKVLELLMLQLEQMANLPNHNPTLSKGTFDKMHAVKDLLQSNMDKPYTLAGLANHVGTNAFYLKRDFKRAFGQTVFGYWHEAKMEEAKTLLLDTGLPVSEVSERVGYKNPCHFTVAFKKKFGVLPKDLKQGRRY